MGAFESVVNPAVFTRTFAKRGMSRSIGSPVFAGLSLEEVQQIVMASQRMSHARKNLFLINVSDYSASSTLRHSLGDALSRMVGT